MLSAERERAYLEIVERGVLNVRTLLGRGEVEQAMIEANHIHNIPALLRREQGQSESAYWDVARVTYLRESKPGWPSAFREMWKTVDPHNSGAALTARATS